jgi:prepilin-type N-terminal cleavage/methylation domain-containing protein/prepilin-type processing-associated H-X9-DG protein
MKLISGGNPVPITGGFLMRLRGFTLIELLVVIAIIAILAAILFPVFAKAREKARQSSCLSNVKQLSLAVFQYAQDYDEMLPVYINPFVPVGSQYWFEAAGPYMKNTQIMQCPSRKNRTYGYGWNIDEMGYGSSTNCGPAVAYGTIQKPAETIWIAESTGAGIYPPRWVTNSAYQYLYDAYRPEQVHNDGGNLGFADGHAKWMQADKFLMDYSLWDKL